MTQRGRPLRQASCLQPAPWSSCSRSRRAGGMTDGLRSPAMYRARRAVRIAALGQGKWPRPSEPHAGGLTVKGEVEIVRLLSMRHHRRIGGEFVVVDDAARPIGDRLAILVEHHIVIV